jgi:hypothetical protein
MAAEGMGQAGSEPTGVAEISEELRSLKAKVVELEEKLIKVVVTEEEWKTYRKVASILVRQGGLPGSCCKDDGETCTAPQQPGPQHCLVLLPLGAVSLQAFVGPMTFVRGFKNLGL